MALFRRVPAPARSAEPFLFSISVQSSQDERIENLRKSRGQEVTPLTQVSSMEPENRNFGTATGREGTMKSGPRPLP